MSTIEEERYAKAWRNDRSRGFVWLGVVFSLFPLAWLTPRSTGKLVIAVWVGVLILATIHWGRFRCPRCDNFFHWRKPTFDRQVGGVYCAHCKLPRRSAAP